jgi:precorrin-4/cobalt-precorrin-4 C11-methyltransferase
MRLHFIGFGPGDPELLTRKGHRLLTEADLIIYPGSIIGREFLSEFSAEKVDSWGMRLGDIVDTIERAVQAGRSVVRLQSGDPSIYGAINEQIALLEERGIESDIVPGVSCVFASAAALGSELTSLDPSLVVTRPAGKTLEKDNLLDFAHLPCTMAVLLGIDHIVEKVASVRGPEEPCGVVYHASRDDQMVIVGTLGDIAARVREEGIDRTATLIIGKSIIGHQRSVLYG